MARYKGRPGIVKSAPQEGFGADGPGRELPAWRGGRPAWQQSIRGQSDAEAAGVLHRLMPFRSEHQRRFMWARHPEIAKRWTKRYGSKPRPAIHGALRKGRRRG